MVMQKTAVRSSAMVLGVTIALVGNGGFGGPARAADKNSPALAHARTPEPKRADRSGTPADPAHPAAPRRDQAPATSPSPSTTECHLAEDIACTIVRETADGTLIVTIHPGGMSAPAPAWSVISGAPPGTWTRTGGTIYVVPTLTMVSNAGGGDQAVLVTANGAPILE
jgi:hypothetical protein